MPKHAHLSTMDPELVPLVPAINASFQSIWEVKDAKVLRDKFSGTRIPPPFVPTTGFSVTHKMVPVSGDAEIEIRVYSPDDRDELSPLFFVAHAGGWATGTHDSESSMTQSVCAKTGMVVISVDYRRAPEHVFPTAVNDCYDAFKWVLDHSVELGVDRSRIILAGSSSGANIVAVIALRARDEGITGIIGQVLNVPVLCHPEYYPSDKYELLSYEQNAKAPTLNSEHMSWFWDLYMPNPSGDVNASPLLAESHAQLPPTLIQAGGLDPLRDEAIAYAEKLLLDGTPVTLKLYPGLPHGFYTISGLRATRVYFEEIVTWVRQRLGFD